MKKQLRILISDSDSISRRVLQSMLVSLGHQVDLASSPEEADNLGHQHRFDLVFADAGPSGLPLALPTVAVPLVLLLADASKDRGGSLTKPIQSEALSSLLQSLYQVA
jgi:DNA-binding response OmpR family regulator